MAPFRNPPPTTRCCLGGNQRSDGRILCITRIWEKTEKKSGCLVLLVGGKRHTGRQGCILSGFRDLWTWNGPLSGWAVCAVGVTLPLQLYPYCLLACFSPSVILMDHGGYWEKEREREMRGGHADGWVQKYSRHGRIGLTAVISQGLSCSPMQDESLTISSTVRSTEHLHQRGWEMGMGKW
jgi:hypothetical protein